MKKNYKGLLFSFIYMILIVITSMGGSLLISGLLFGQNGVNTAMEVTNNLLMGILGAPIIILLTKRCYQKNFLEQIKEVDFFSTRTSKKILLSLCVSFMIVATLFFVQVLSGADIVFQGITTNWLSFFSGLTTFIGMAVLEECIFRGILRQAFAIFGQTTANLLPIALFVALHMDVWKNFELLRIIELIIAGLFFTCILEKTGSLMLVSVVHATFNISLAMIFGIDTDSGLLKTTSFSPLLGLSGEEFSTIILMVILLAFIVYYFIDRSFKKHKVQV